MARKAVSPTALTREQYVSLVCEEIATSDKGISRICKAFRETDSDFPSAPTILRWATEDPSLMEQYTRAKEEQADVLVDQIIEISDDRSGDIAFREDGTQYTDTEHIQRARLRVDSRKWIASKLRPKKYGDKILSEVTGADGSPLFTGINISLVKPQ